MIASRLVTAIGVALLGIADSPAKPARPKSSNHSQAAVEAAIAKRERRQQKRRSQQ